ncbi:hypothetical protein Lepto7376_0840 [[Leptolyngbya] sp. PCC 7376]|uniref:sulfotransferase family 2 domain-containing protein n=1 Tax=[Leptolyngbya] sp. PCC 7376 TaxID=111781 RepID=UPI00029F0488|nr:sulfotransferase family 2 domain-containing protein [[Leptolyngbya] sp. PCC 7376]AFY37235.1 hypothetical protein Lepto7376_0840 [[Leptolyngbya] sp. PCC 7376]
MYNDKFNLSNHIKMYSTPSGLDTKKKFIVFLHIQKTGGISLQRIFRRKLGRSILGRVMGLLNRQTPPSEVREIMRQKSMKDRYFIGHFCYGIDRDLPKPLVYMTFLREPVSRIISLYEYSVNNPTAYYHEHAVGKTLEEFALHTPLFELDNGQVRFIAGDSNSYFINQTPAGECDESLLDLAIKHIEEDFALVGLTEYFDHSVLLLKEIMDWNFSLYLRRNTSKSKEKLNVSPELREKIREKNNLDVALYEYAEKRLKQQLAEYQLDNEKIIADFRERNVIFNRLFGTVYGYYDFMKAFARGQIGRPS